MANYRQCGDCFRLSQMPMDKCKHCGSTVSFPRMSVGAPSLAPFESGYYRDIALEPIYIKNRQQLRDETRSRGQVSNYVEGGI